MSELATQVFVALIGVTAVNIGALISFVISISVKVGKLETRVDTNERDIDNLGAMVRKNEKTQLRRVA